MPRFRDKDAIGNLERVAIRQLGLPGTGQITLDAENCAVQFEERVQRLQTFHVHIGIQAAVMVDDKVAKEVRPLNAEAERIVDVEVLRILGPDEAPAIIVIVKAPLEPSVSTLPARFESIEGRRKLGAFPRLMKKPRKAAHPIRPGADRCARARRRAAARILENTVGTLKIAPAETAAGCVCE
jgi:hypothetical protein